MTRTTKRALLITVLLLVVVGFILYKFRTPANEIYDQLSAQTLQLMYNVNDVEDLIKNNESILSKFDKSQWTKLDIRDEKVFLGRYSNFKNQSTQLTVDKSYSFENTVVVFYTISTGADFPVSRVAIFTYGDGNLVTDFTEHQTYPVLTSKPTEEADN